MKACKIIGDFTICFATALLLTQAVLFLSCFSSATPSDLTALKKANEAFGDEFKITPRESIYIEARYTEKSCPDQKKGTALYSTLLLENPDAKREDTAYTYLNIWAGSGQFCYQLSFDRNTKTIKKSNQAYY